MEETKPVVREIFGVKSRDESTIIAFSDFWCNVESSWFFNPVVLQVCRVVDRDNHGRI